MAAKSILIVDDNPVNSKLIRVLLAGEGYDVHTAGDADEALRVLKNLSPQLILMDVQLPGNIISKGNRGFRLRCVHPYDSYENSRR